MTGETGGAQEYEHDGTPYFGSYAILETNGWGVVVETPVSVILTESNMLARRLLLVNVVLSVSALAVSLVFTRQITAARQRMEEKVRTLARFPSENPNPVLRVAKDGTILYANKGSLPVLNVWGCQEGQSLPDDWHKSVLDALSSGLSKGAEVGHEDRVLSLTFAPVVDADYVNVYGLDVTERKQAEETLQESEQWLSTTLRSIGDAVIATDAKGLVTLMNPVAEDLIGWGEAEGVGKPLEDVFNIINEKTGERAENPVARVLREGLVVGLANHTVLIAKDGTKRPIADSGAPMRDKEGNLIGTVIVFRDITERVRVEEERLRAVATTVEAMGDGLIVSTMDGEIAFVNRAYEEMTGYEKSELVGTDSTDLVQRTYRLEDLEKVTEAVTTASEGRVPVPTPLTLVSKDGRETPVTLTVSFVPDAKGKPTTIIVVIRDITELQEMQERLVRQGKLAVLGQLSGSVGHELRNPLGVISNAVYFLQMVLTNADDTTREYLGIIGSEVRNAEKIVSDLLDLSRTRPAEREEVALSDLVAETLDKQPPPEGVAVTTRIASNLPIVFVDRLQMGRVLANLVANAYQAMPDGGELLLSARVDGDRVCLCVTDTGCGVPPENIGKIFEPLFTTRARGIGLGLTVSRNLVQVNGGTIEVQSEERQGSTFTVALPARNASRTRSREVRS